jgi:hypothetical protein
MLLRLVCLFRGHVLRDPVPDVRIWACGWCSRCGRFASKRNP